MTAYFGTDGIRGHVGRPPMTPGLILRLGFAIGRAAVDRSGGSRPRVLVSKDTRLSGYIVESALEAGIAASGAEVTLSGPLPTSAVSYLTRTLRMSAGIVISASHNPYRDNGIKVFGPDGRKISGEAEAEIEARMADAGDLVFDDDPGKATRLGESSGRYIEFCKGTFPQDLDLFGVRLVVDCANGAAYRVAPAIFRELGAEVVAIHNRPNGRNINLGCGVVAPGSARDRVLETGAHLGVVLDGDADRLLVVDRHGRLHDGDALLHVLVRDRVDSGRPPAGVVGTVMSNLALERHVTGLGIGFARTPVGDRHVCEELARRGWELGGEPSGHVVMLDRHVTGDGIITALQALAIMRRTGLPFDRLAEGHKPVPAAVRSVDVADKAAALALPPVRDAIREVERELGGRGRVLVRPSGTEGKIRVLVEGGLAAERIGELAGRVAAAIKGGEPPGA